jgi:hypothetical protein
VPAFYFPRDVELWSKAGTLVKKLADVPMADTFPRNGVFAGPRGFQWHLAESATLLYLEALDGGDPQKKAEYRDRVMTLAAPFTGQPMEGPKTAWRAGGLQFTEGGAVLLSESDRDSRMRRTWLFEKGSRRRRRRSGSFASRIATAILAFQSPAVYRSHHPIRRHDLSQRHRRVAERRSAVRRCVST